MFYEMKRILRRGYMPPASVGITVKIRHWIQLNKSSALLRAAGRFVLSVLAIFLIAGIVHGARADLEVAGQKGASCFGCPGATMTDWREGTYDERYVAVKKVRWGSKL